MATSPDPAVADGRSARRERNRAAVIDALFELLAEGHFPPATEEIADRSGVSPSSVFRYFDSLDDLQRQTVEAHLARFEPLFTVPSADSRDGRIRVLTRARLDLHEATAPIARVVRMRAPEHPRLAETLESIRALLSAQAREHFQADLAGLGRAGSEDRVALIDTLTSFESWDLLHAHHGRSRHRIARAWTAGIGAILG